MKDVLYEEGTKGFHCNFYHILISTSKNQIKKKQRKKNELFSLFCVCFFYKQKPKTKRIIISTRNFLSFLFSSVCSLNFLYSSTGGGAQTSKRQ